MVGIFLFLVGQIPSHNVDTIDLFPQNNPKKLMRISTRREQMFEKSFLTCYSTQEILARKYIPPMPSSLARA